MEKEILKAEAWGGQTVRMRRLRRKRELFDEGIPEPEGTSQGSCRVRKYAVVVGKGHPFFDAGLESRGWNVAHVELDREKVTDEVVAKIRRGADGLVVGNLVGSEWIVFRKALPGDDTAVLDNCKSQ